MRRMVTRRQHRLGRSKRKLPCREKRIGQRGRSMPGMFRSQCN